MTTGGETALVDVITTSAGEGASRVEATLADRWRIVYAQGGAVMAATLETALAAVRRDELALVSAVTTFHQPVRCDRVILDAIVLRSSRSSAQVRVELRPAVGDEAGPAATTTAVLAAEQPGWPDLSDAPVPPVLATGLDLSGRRLAVPGLRGINQVPFFDETQWQEVTTDPLVELEWHGWFRFARPPAHLGRSWPSPLLAVPADALGCSVVPSVRLADRPVFALSLQMSLHVLGPARSEWLALRSRGLHVVGGIATGLTSLWDEAGVPVAVSTQSALLRAMPAA